MKPLITSRTDWSESLIKDIYKHIEDIAIGELQYDVYPNQIEIISAEQMLDAYASIGMPVNYSHWSFGKEFLQNWTKYQKGKQGLAYEIVINTSPCIAYLMEENNAVTQALVIAHASFGHNFVNKNNYLFRDWTQASSIIDYLIFAKNYIRDCELKYGEEEVESFLDACHAISSHAVDKQKRKHKKKLSEEETQAKEAQQDDENQKHLDIILQSTALEKKNDLLEAEDLDKVDDEENLLYFIYKNSPTMKPWQREICRIIYKIRQYFFPQGRSQVLNEGFATFTHFYIMNELEKKGLLSADAQIAWLHLHSNVIFQPDISSRYYSGRFNPYALGLDIYNEIRRICETPTKEDEEWFPSLAGKDWKLEVKRAASEYQDDSFIEQFLSPALMRKYKMFTVHVDEMSDYGIVQDISDERGYREMRRTLAAQYNSIERIPEIVVSAARMRGDRALVLEYKPYLNRTLFDNYAAKTCEYIKQLWGYEVELIERDPKNPDSIHRIYQT
jgi:stage V sporulation protein R